MPIINMQREKANFCTSVVWSKLDVFLLDSSVHVIIVEKKKKKKILLLQ